MLESQLGGFTARQGISDCEVPRARTSYRMIFRGKKALSIFLTALALALVFASNSPAAATAVTEAHGTASDGTILGGGFDAGTPNDSAESVICAQDLADAGYLALSIEYRLAPPGRLSGQISSGRFPDQPDDIKVAVRAARSDSRSTGQVGSVGGSAVELILPSPPPPARRATTGSMSALASQAP